MNQVSKKDNLVMLERVIPSGKVDLYNSLELHYKDIPDGKVVLQAYPLESRKYYGKNPQVHMLHVRIQLLLSVCICWLLVYICVLLLYNGMHVSYNCMDCMWLHVCSHCRM
jgi:hypothetical protein